MKRWRFPVRFGYGFADAIECRRVENLKKKADVLFSNESITNHWIEAVGS